MIKKERDSALPYLSYLNEFKHCGGHYDIDVLVKYYKPGTQKKRCHLKILTNLVYRNAAEIVLLKLCMLTKKNWSVI